MTEETTQQPYEPNFQVIDITADIMSQDIALLISEQMAHEFRVLPAEPDGNEVAIVLSAERTARPGLVVLPVDDRAAVLRISCSAFAATSMYLAVAKENMIDVERALFGLAKDFEFINIETAIKFFDEEGNLVSSSTNRMLIPSSKLQAVWMNMKPFMDHLQTQGTVTIVNPGE